MPTSVAPTRRLGFLSPREVLAHSGAAGECGDTLRNWGVLPGPVLVVADAVVAEAGLLASLTRGLLDAGFAVTVFADVAGEPTDAQADRAADVGRSLGACAVIGVGGGSAMDLAKVVALLLTNEGRAAEWIGVVEPPNRLPPLVLVPTTTGTGSEATRIAMLTVDGVKRVLSCVQFVPLVAVLDPDLVAGLPPSVVASTGMDALAHAVESMLSTNRTEFTLSVGARAARLLNEHLEAAVLGDSASARGHVLYAAHLSGLALNAGVVLGHSLAYVVARHQPMPHGTSCALALPYCLAYNIALDEPLAAEISRAATGGRESTLAAAAVFVEGLSARLGLPRSLAEVGVSVDELEDMAAETVRDYPRPSNPRPLEVPPILDLFRHMHAGDVRGACTESRAQEWL